MQSKGYGTLSALLPSTGSDSNAPPVTAQNDADYVRSRMLLPVLDVEQHDVILITHSYSGMPGSAAARGLGKAERAAQGKTTSVLGQIFLAAFIPRGGDGKDITAMFGGQMPPHIVVDVSETFHYLSFAVSYSPLHRKYSCSFITIKYFTLIRTNLSRNRRTCLGVPIPSHLSTKTFQKKWQMWQWLRA